MKPFRFRAAAALDLRRQREDEARLAQAQAEIELRAADGRVAAARGAVERAVEASASTERAGADAWLITWHRSWITRLRLEVAARQHAAAISAAAAECAVASMRKAHQRRRTSAADQKKDPLGRDAFMNLLITQLQHQDPTQPQADGEFLAQLAQFSSLEQLQSVNQKLDAISSFFTQAQPAATTTEGKP
jgi:hypothetical protein